MNHHAYVYEGPLALLPALATDARERFSKEKSSSQAHEEVWQKFGIEEARALTQLSSLRSVGGSMLFVLGLGSITLEAQQALLKLFEEPQAGTTFVLLVPHGTLLPTVRSRFMPYPARLGAAGAEAEHEWAGEARTFLSSGYAERSAWITGFIKKDDDTLREQARNFLNALEQVLYSRFSKVIPPTDGKELEPTRDLREGLEDIGHFRQYLADRSPSLKMILEHFAATLPLLR